MINFDNTCFGQIIIKVCMMLNFGYHVHFFDYKKSCPWTGKLHRNKHGPIKNKSLLITSKRINIQQALTFLNIFIKLTTFYMKMYLQNYT